MHTRTPECQFVPYAGGVAAELTLLPEDVVAPRDGAELLRHGDPLVVKIVGVESEVSDFDMATLAWAFSSATLMVFCWPFSAEDFRQAIAEIKSRTTSSSVVVLVLGTPETIEIWRELGGRIARPRCEQLLVRPGFTSTMPSIGTH